VGVDVLYYWSYTVKNGENTVTKTNDQLVEKLTWEALRKKASVMGIPAWKLAENFAVHEQNGQLIFKNPSS
jgi:hypothetical protein